MKILDRIGERMFITDTLTHTCTHIIFYLDIELDAL